jgi:glucose-1-phosphate thymidylyltransferase
MMDMVETSSRSRVKAIQIKPSRTRLKYTWVVCIWSRQFYDFLHGFLKGPENLHRGVEESRELHMGDVIQKAIESGLMVESVKFSNGRCRDIGTPEGLEYILGQGSGFKI